MYPEVRLRIFVVGLQQPSVMIGLALFAIAYAACRQQIGPFKSDFRPQRFCQVVFDIQL